MHIQAFAPAHQNYVRLLIITFIIIFSIELQFRANEILFPQLRKASNVVRHSTLTKQKNMNLKAKIILSAAVIFTMIIVYFYLVLRDEVKEVSSDIPYSEIINDDLIAFRSSIFIDNSALPYSKEYPKELENYENIDTSEVFYTVVPKGSIFKFKKALQIMNSTSGFTRSYLFGEVSLAGTKEKHAIMYSWGLLEQDVFQRTDDYWKFEMAPWQTDRTKNRHLPPK